MNGRTIVDVVTPRLATPPAKPLPKICPECAAAELTIQRLREAYALLTQAVALSDIRKRPR